MRAIIAIKGKEKGSRRNSVSRRVWREYARKEEGVSEKGLVKWRKRETIKEKWKRMKDKIKEIVRKMEEEKGSDKKKK